MKKITVLAFAALALTIGLFVYQDFLIKTVVRIQRADDPNQFTAEDMLKKVEPILIGTVEFDGQIIEFYYDEDMLENNGIYYTLQGKQQQITYPQAYINSKDNRLRFFVNYDLDYTVHADNQPIEPNQVIQLKAGNRLVDAQLYHLDKSKQITLKSNLHFEEYSFGCSVHALCGHIESMQPEIIEAFLPEWKKTSWPDGLKFGDLDYLLTFRQNRYAYDFISGGYTVHYIDYLTAQDEHGRFYVVKETNTHEFYELTASQWEEFQTFLKSYSSQ